jgi:hypothetical protein
LLYTFPTSHPSHPPWPHTHWFLINLLLTSPLLSFVGACTCKTLVSQQQPLSIIPYQNV